MSGHRLDADTDSHTYKTRGDRYTVKTIVRRLTDVWAKLELSGLDDGGGFGRICPEYRNVARMQANTTCVNAAYNLWPDNQKRSQLKLPHWARNNSSPKSFGKSRVATSHGREQSRPLLLLIVQCPLQTSSIAQPRVRYIHTTFFLYVTLCCSSLLPKSCLFLLGYPPNVKKHPPTHPTCQRLVQCDGTCRAAGNTMAFGMGNRTP